MALFQTAVEVGLIFFLIQFYKNIIIHAVNTIFSYLSLDSGFCAGGLYPDVYTEVGNYIDWINKWTLN